jgi:hypothetical protein
MSNSKKKSKHKPSSNPNSKSKSKSNLTTAHQVTEFIEKQPTDVREEVTDKLIAQRFESMSYSGPIPPPHLLREFNDSIPNGADRIMKMAEQQSTHRMDLETKVVTANNRDALLGVIFAGIIGIIIVIGSMFLIYNNKNIQGLGILFTSAVAYIGVFLKSKSRDDKNLKEKE